MKTSSIKLRIRAMGLDPNYKSKKDGHTLVKRVMSNFVNAIPEAEIEKALKQIRDDNKATAEKGGE